MSEQQPDYEDRASGDFNRKKTHNSLDGPREGYRAKKNRPLWSTKQEGKIQVTKHPSQQLMRSIEKEEEEEEGKKIETGEKFLFHCDALSLYRENFYTCLKYSPKST